MGFILFFRVVFSYYSIYSKRIAHTLYGQGMGCIRISIVCDDRGEWFTGRVEATVAVLLVVLHELKLRCNCLWFTKKLSSQKVGLWE